MPDLGAGGDAESLVDAAKRDSVDLTAFVWQGLQNHDWTVISGRTFNVTHHFSVTETT